MSGVAMGRDSYGTKYPPYSNVRWLAASSYVGGAPECGRASDDRRFVEPEVAAAVPEVDVAAAVVVVAVAALSVVCDPCWVLAVDPGEVAVFPACP